MTKYACYQQITCVLCWLHYQFSITFTNPKLFSVTFVQSVVLHPVFPRYNILSSCLFVCFPSSLFPQVFQSKNLYAFFIYSIHVLCYTDLIIHDCGATYYEAPYFVSFVLLFSSLQLSSSTSVYSLAHSFLFSYFGFGSFLGVKFLAQVDREDCVTVICITLKDNQVAKSLLHHLGDEKLCTTYNNC